MKRILALLTIGLALLWAQTAVAAITEVNMGAGTQAASTTNTVTSAVGDCPIGSTIVVIAAYATIADTLTSVTSSPANTFQVPVDNITGTGAGIGVAYAKNTTADVPQTTGTVTATFAGSVASRVVTMCLTGASAAAPLDIHGVTAQGLASTSATTTNTGALAGSTEFVIGAVASPTSAGTLTCGGSYSSLFTPVSTPSLGVCGQAVASSASVAFSPAWTNTVNYVTDLVTFTAGGGAAGSHLLGTLSVGN